MNSFPEISDTLYKQQSNKHIFHIQTLIQYYIPTLQLQNGATCHTHQSQAHQYPFVHNMKFLKVRSFSQTLQTVVFSYYWH